MLNVLVLFESILWAMLLSQRVVFSELYLILKGNEENKKKKDENLLVFITVSSIV